MKENGTAQGFLLLPSFPRTEGETKIKLTQPKQPPGFSQRRASRGNTSPPQKKKKIIKIKTNLKHECTGSIPHARSIPGSCRTHREDPGLLSAARHSELCQPSCPDSQHSGGKKSKPTTKKTHIRIGNVPFRHHSPGKRGWVERRLGKR